MSRCRNPHEEDEKNTLKLSGTQKHFDKSLIAKNLVNGFIKGIHQILDFSSIDKDTLLYKTCIKENPINSCIWEILSALRKNSPLYFKEEIGGQHLQAFFGCSPKQYSLICFDKSLKIPSLTITNKTTFTPHDQCTTECTENLLTHPKHTAPIMKIKGVKRSIQQKILTPEHFQRTSERFCTPLRIVQHSLIRRNRRIFLVSQSRLALTRFCNKAYFCKSHSTTDNHFSFPLFMKELVES